MFKISNEGMLEVKLTVSDSISDEQINQLKDLGMDVQITLPEYGIIEGSLPYDAVETIADIDFIKHVGTPGYPIYNTGSVTSEGDSVLTADLARSTFGINGSGSKIGVMSDGIDNLSASVASGDLPSDVQVLKAGNGSEGTAMLEIIHDLAPGANLAFYSPSSSSDMIVGIGALESAGCNIIVDDITCSDEPKFEDGPIAQRASNFVNAGGIYVASAGNERLRHYSSPYNQSACTLGGYPYAHDYNYPGFPPDWSNNFTIPNGSSIIAVLQWTNKVSNSSTDDFDFWLLNKSGAIDYAHSTNDQSDGSYTSPLEYFTYINDTGSTIFNASLVVLEYSLVSDPSSIVLDYKVYSCPSLLQYNTTNDSVIGHAAVEEVLSTAAVDAATPETLESYSSCGPGTIYFPSYEQRQVPNITGTDGVNTETGLLGYFDNPFYGTSASAPHIAAIAALVWDANPSLTSSQVRSAITSTAVDLSTAGFDYNSGWGRANASAAVNSTVFTLNISSSSGGTVTTPGVGTFHPYIGQVVNISATPNSCYHFVNWSPDTGTIANPTSPSTTITMNASYSIQANFAASDTFGGGDGTPDDPFLIIDTWNLQAMSCNLSAHYALNNSIDALATSGWNSGLGFLPVGNDSNQFSGSFDGRGYEITNLYINRLDTDYVGLFGYINTVSSVGNTSLVNVNITGNSYVGGLMGYNVNGTVSNSYATGNVSGSSTVGGLVGYNYNGSVSNSYATGNVSGSSTVGGLVGYNYNGSVSNSYATGNVSGTSDHVGGLIGYNGNSPVSNSYATGNVNGSSYYVGGLIGYNGDSPVSNSYATGNVSGTNYYAGGLVGYNWNSGSVSNSYATGNVNGVNPVGGLVGFNDNGLVSNSYATGNVSGALDIGGLVGDNSGSVSNSFWDIDTSSQTTSDGGTGKNTSEMKSFLTFFNAGWDLFCEDANGTEDIWRIDETCTDNSGYPSLWWQGLTHNGSVTLTITTSGSGSGTFTPASGTSYPCGTVVNLNASPNACSTFSG
ncbi:MAG: GLUG motif-containing protein, partial [Dehalococcoidia bacterium]